VIKVLLAKLPAVIAEASERTIAAAADLERSDPAGPYHAAIVGSDSPLSPSAADELLARRPRAKVVCVSPDATSAALHELRHHVLQIHDVGFDAIFDAIRAACAKEGEPCPPH
jgi:hypothetical protein